MKRSFVSISACVLCVSLGVIHAGGTETARITPVVKVVGEWGDSVVSISTENVVFLRLNPSWGDYGGLFDDMAEGFLEERVVGAMKLKGLGSGVIVSSDGLIATNAHVVNMASKIYVIFKDGSVAMGRVVAARMNYDIALIKVDVEKRLKPAVFAKDVIVGETVIGIGNPLGLENSVTAGIVSAVNRDFYFHGSGKIFSGLIQTDASINPGNSGGALLNLDGELVGINLAVVQNAQDIGFAIPSVRIKHLLDGYTDYKDSGRNVVKIKVE